MSPDCYAWRLTAGLEPLPGDRIHPTEKWIAEHFTGSVDIGTLIGKPFRHCVHLGEITGIEAQELGPLLRRILRVVQHLGYRTHPISSRARHQDQRRKKQQSCGQEAGRTNCFGGRASCMDC